MAMTLWPGKNMVVRHQQNHQPGVTDWSWLCSWIYQWTGSNVCAWRGCYSKGKSVCYLFLGFIACLNLPITHELAATNAYERIWIDDDSVTMSNNESGICYESSTIFRIGEFVAKFWTVQIFWSDFPIDLRIARTDYRLYDSVKIFANWVRFSHKSKYLSICGDSWDSGPVWNRGIKQYFLHKLSLETDKNPSWISGRWRMNVFLFWWPISRK